MDYLHSGPFAIDLSSIASAAKGASDFVVDVTRSWTHLAATD